jgi:hypothetical protein
MHIEGRSVDCTFFDCEAAPQAQRGTLVQVVQGDFLGSPNPVRVLDPTSAAIWVGGTVDAVDAQNKWMSVLGFPIQALPGTLLNTSGPPAPFSAIEVGDAVTVGGGAVDDLLAAGSISFSSPSGPVNPSIAIVGADATARISFAEPEIHVLGQTGTILTDPSTAVHDGCEGDKELRWLFDVAATVPLASLQFDVSQTDTGEVFATDIGVLTASCDRAGPPM